MRRTFVKTLTDIAEHDDRIFLLTGDLGYMALEPFADRFPDRFINAGVAEQNMVGVATGLAEAGFIPFVYSIITFATLRAYEFIRNGPIQHRLPVRIIGVGGGVEYGHNGASHYGLEDIAIMRVQPGISIVAPADSAQTRNALLETWNLDGPIFYRLGKDDSKLVVGLDGRFDISKTQVIKEGTDLLFVTTGSIGCEVVRASEMLEAEGISCSIAIVSCFNSQQIGHLSTLLEDFAQIITVEAHYENGGLGSLVSELVASRGLRSRVKRLAISSQLDGITGSEPFLLEKYGLSARAIAAQAKSRVSASLQTQIGDGVCHIDSATYQTQVAVASGSYSNFVSLTGRSDRPGEP